MLKEETIALKLGEMEQDFTIQLKRSSTCLRNGDEEGSKRWSDEALKTSKCINNLLKFVR